MAAADIELTEDYSCGYCLQRLPYMTDPRALPCSHVFCLPCLQQDYKESESMECVVCGQIGDQQPLETLSKVEAARMFPTADTESVSVDQLHCDLCKDKINMAVSYCMDCGKKLCEDHLKLDKAYSQQFLGEEHSTIDIEVYQISPTKYGLEMCEEHGNQRLIQACSKCHQIFCLRCETEATCKVVTDITGKIHQVTLLEKFADGKREELKVLLKSLSAKITELARHEKGAWKRLGDVEVKAKVMTDEVDKATNEQITAIKKESATVKAQIAKHLCKSTENIESYTTTLMSKREQLQQLWRSTHQLLTQSRDAEFVSKQKENVDKLQQAAVTEAKSCTVFDGQLVHNGHFKKLEVRFLSTLAPPTSLSLYKTIAGNCLSVCWTEDRRLLATGNRHLSLYDAALQKLKCVTGFNGEGVAEHSSGFVVNIDGGSQWTPTWYDKDLSSKLKLATYYSDNSSYAQLTVRPITGQTITVDPVKKQLIVYSKEHSLQYHVKLTGVKLPRGIHTLPDGTVLVSDYEYGTVSRYSLSPPPQASKVLWTCAGLKAPTGISSDEIGYIYAVSRDEKCVYIISQNGEMVGTLTHPALQDKSLYDVSVSGDLMAVACLNDGIMCLTIGRTALPLCTG